MRFACMLLLAAVLLPDPAGAAAFATAGAPVARTTGFETVAAVSEVPSAPGWASPIALEHGWLASRPMSGDPDKTGKHGPSVLSSERAQALLRSLTLPGWGQASLGHTTSAAVFGVIEAGVWVSFAAFKIQEGMRTDTYMRTADTFAGIDLSGRSDEYRRMVGSYPSSDDYNKFVVYRDAANLYYDNPAAMAQYIDSHSLKGADQWAWVSPESYTAYQAQRKNAQQAALNANTALAVAVANRIVSALHAARIAGHPKQGWRLDVQPDDRDPTAFQMAVRTSF